jgi:hypothetical protein
VSRVPLDKRGTSLKSAVFPGAVAGGGLNQCSTRFEALPINKLRCKAVFQTATPRALLSAVRH